MFYQCTIRSLQRNKAFSLVGKVGTGWFYHTVKLVSQASKGFLHWAIIIVNIVITFSVGSYSSGQNTLNTFLEKIPSLKWGVKDIFIYKVQCDDITRAKEMLSLAIQRIELSIVTVGMTDRVDKAL